jgi:hypothetical protein
MIKIEKMKAHAFALESNACFSLSIPVFSAKIELNVSV